MQAVGPICRVANRIDLRKARVRTFEVRAVLQRNIGEAIGIEDKVACNWSRRDYTFSAGAVGAVADLVNGSLLSGIEGSDWSDDCGIGE